MGIVRMKKKIWRLKIKELERHHKVGEICTEDWRQKGTSLTSKSLSYLQPALLFRRRESDGSPAKWLITQAREASQPTALDVWGQ